MTQTGTTSPLVPLLAEAGEPMAHGTTEEKLAWSSRTWRATVAQARETNAARAAEQAAAPAPWTPRYGHRH